MGCDAQLARMHIRTYFSQRPNLTPKVGQTSLFVAYDDGSFYWFLPKIYHPELLYCTVQSPGCELWLS